MLDKVVIRVISKKSPDQSEKPKSKEVIVYHWNRIFGALFVVLALAAVLIWGGQRVFQRSVNGSQAAIEPAPSPKAQPSISGVHSRIPEEVKHEDKAKSSEIAPPVAIKPTPLAPTLPAKAEEPIKPETQKKVVAKPPDRDADRPTSDTPSKSVISILSTNIERAQLASNVIKGEAVDNIGPVIPMNDKGLIRVYLFMETSGLKGQTLFHDWYWNGKRIAHARIPIKRKDNTASSSKFIDRIMMGHWEVNIVDGGNKVLAKAEFEVR